MALQKQPLSLEADSRAAKLERDVASLVYQGIDTPVSLSCYLLLVNGEIDQLVTKTISPLHYNSVDSFRDDYLVVSLLSKSRMQTTSFVKKEACHESYLQSEKLCLATNERLLLFRDGLVSPIDPTVATIVAAAQRLIRQWIPPLTKATLRQVENDMNFGPGATVGVRRVVTSGRKFDLTNIDCSASLLSYGIHCLPEFWKQRVTGFTVTDYATLEYVPKNCKTDRAIEVQPTLNIYVQKGAGSLIRKALRELGLDLSDQTENQKLAAVGSRDSTLVTADLSNASDTIAHQCVRHMLALHPDLLELLEFSRVGRSRLKDGTYIELEKFSAMGNGYTFELETLIYYSLLIAVREHLGCSLPARVYGDDIIVSQKCWPLLKETLNFLGFSVNARKTFGNTYFRESCGADFFDGVNVRPVFFKQETKTTYDFKETCYIYANQLLQYAHHSRGGLYRDRRLFRAWLLCFDSVNASERFRVPDGFTANGFLGSLDESTPSLRRDNQNGWQGYFFKYSHRSSATTSRYTLGALTATLKSGSADFTFGEETLRGSSNRLPPTTRRGYSLEWPHYGPWA